MRAQDNSMNLDGIAKGYANEAEKVMSAPSAPAIRNEVKKYMTEVTSTEGPEQLEHLNKLVRALDAYKTFFKDTWADEKERAPFALALALREKSLQ